MSKKTALTHSEVREKLCLICRTSKNTKKGSIRKIIENSEIHNRIKLYYYPAYDPSDILLPCALCTRDAQLLLDISRGKKDTSELRPPVLWPREFYPPGDFQSKTDCFCPLCRIVRAKVEAGHDLSSHEFKTPFPRGRPWPTTEGPESPEMAEAFEPPEAMEALPAVLEAQEAPPEAPPEEPSSDKCCTTCTQVWEESSLLLDTMSIQEIQSNCTI